MSGLRKLANFLFYRNRLDDGPVRRMQASFKAHEPAKEDKRRPNFASVDSRSRSRASSSSSNSSRRITPLQGASLRSSAEILAPNLAASNNGEVGARDT